MVISKVLDSLILLSLSAQALAASDLSTAPSTSRSYSTFMMPTATDLSSMSLGSSSTLTISSFPTAFSTMGSTAVSEPTTKTKITPDPNGSEIKKRCNILKFWDCTEAAVDTNATKTSSVVTVYQTVHNRAVVATPSPRSEDPYQDVKGDQDSETVESNSGSLSSRRHNARRIYRSASQSNHERENSNVKRSDLDNSFGKSS